MALHVALEEQPSCGKVEYQCDVVYIGCVATSAWWNCRRCANLPQQLRRRRWWWCNDCTSDCCIYALMPKEKLLLAVDWRLSLSFHTTYSWRSAVCSEQFGWWPLTNYRRIRRGSTAARVARHLSPAWDKDSRKTRYKFRLAHTEQTRSDTIVHGRNAYVNFLCSTPASNWLSYH